MNVLAPQRTLTIAGVLLGLGFGGFFDGIVLHQILQWHHLLTSTGKYPANTVAGLEMNTFGDGLFHILTYVMSIIGLGMLWRVLLNTRRDTQPTQTWSTVAFLGTILMGWGTFNLVEGIVNHHLLGIHHVRTGSKQLLWDIGFLLWGALMLGGGWVMRQRG